MSGNFFWGITNFLNPKVLYRYNLETNKPEVYRESDNPIEPSEYTVKQEWCTSKDGTKIPMFLVHQKTVKQDGSAPALVSSYGGYGISKTPGFFRNWLPWLRRGGVFVLANLRGGGEFGEEWHRQGRLENKQNTFDDLIAVSEHLIEQNYTNQEKLAIIGGSNGGLTVGAVMVQRPDLFKAVVCRVPVLDMARYHKLLIAERWKFEWGDPEKPEEFKWLMAYSPYHNVKADTKYPALFLVTGEKDSRVDPMHARKMAALMQKVNPHNSTLLFTEMEAGHGMGRPVYKLVETQAYILAALTLPSTML